jgi:O-methyltransferase
MSALDSFAKGLYRRLATRHRRTFCRLKMLKDHAVEADEKFWELYTAALNENAFVQPFEDFFNLYQLVLKTRKVPGAIAELGVFRGSSARLIASLKDGKELHLFDTFEGMPEVRADADLHSTGDFGGSWLEEVKRRLSAFDRISFHKGFFPDSARELGKTPVRFSLVHLDVDIYESTKAGLEFFYPRTVTGGVIISHDYRSQRCPGVKRAFDEFFADKPEPVIELWKTQCLLVKQ